VDPVSLDVTIARPRADVFAYLVDVANHAEFTDHFLVDWRLTREDSVGAGAGARYKLRARLNRFGWADVTFVEVVAPRRIVAVGRSGKFNRIRQLAVWELEPAAAGGSTRVTLQFQTEPRLPSDRLIESLTARRVKRGYARSLRRLRDILEEDRGRGRRATIAGGPRKPATDSPLRWGERVGSGPSH
jgi:uncharacterized protein YndB with AHSA1/START domain